SETVCQLVYENTVPDPQSRLHRAAGDLEGPHHERAERQQEDQAERQGQGDPAAGKPGDAPPQRGTRPALRARCPRGVLGRVRAGGAVALRLLCFGVHRGQMLSGPGVTPEKRSADRKSTRLNSSHVKISYAV